MKEKRPLVTVGIPTYNRPAGLEATLRAMLGQTYPNLQILVSDNHSTDPAVREVLERYAAADPRVTFVVQETNRHIIPNFQYLLDHAEGRYFCWAADDDQWSPDFIARCVDGLEGNAEAVAAITEVELFFDDQPARKARLRKSYLQRGLFSRSFQFIRSHSESRYIFCGVYRLDAIRGLQLPDCWGGDHLFVYEVLTRGGFLFLGAPSSFRYYRGGSSKGMASVRKAFNIRSRFYFYDAYVLAQMTRQFRFTALSWWKKCGLFFVNGAALLCSEEFILYYIFIKKPFRALFRRTQQN